MATSDQPGEFERIKRYFAPLSEGAAGALSLTDDAAILSLPPGQEMVVSTDMLVGDVHFPADDSPEAIAHKMLRVNLSDLAAMAAKPVSYTLAAAWTAEQNDAWLKRFAAALAALQAEFSVSLVGGDTVKTPGPLSFSVTIFGRVDAGAALLRSAAKSGDAVLVSGTIGDGYLGLLAYQNRLPEAGLSGPEREALLAKYQRPPPRLELAQAVKHLAHAAIDVSDGFLADLGHILEASEVGAVIDVSKIPFSEPAAKLLAREVVTRDDLITGGDDYELIFTAPSDRVSELQALAEQASVPLSHVGAISERNGLQLHDETGRTVRVDRAGWHHF